MGYMSKSDKAQLFIGGAFLICGVAYFISRCGGEFNSNRDKIDTQKCFNYYIDYNEDGVAIVKVSSYTDYSGNTVEFYTQDGLHILTGLESAELVYANTYEEAYNRALELAGGNKDLIISYDGLRNLSPENTSDGYWNKDILNFDYQFEYAITETENGVVVTNMYQWKDWDDDDKVQYIDMSGNVYLSTFTNTQLVNMSNEENASEAIYDYALSLAGSEDRLFGDIDKETGTVKKLTYTYE